MSTTTKVTYTPGPWEVESGMVQTVCEHDCKLEVKCGVHIPIAWMDREAGTLPCERDANAHLIAAAPELLEALKNTKHHLELFIGPDDKIGNLILKEAVTAIRKAKGADPEATERHKTGR